MKFPSIFKKKTILLPTTTGWIFFGASFFFISFFVFTNIHQFLTKTERLGGDLLVVEGWLPDYALKEAVQIFSKGNYKLIISTGGPLDNGSYLLQFNTYAQLGELSLNKMGIDDSLTVAVPAQSVRKDRTYQSAVAFNKWLSSSGVVVKKIDLLSLGAHTRRSAMVYQKLLGPQIEVGKISIDNADYDSGQWWKSSEGVKEVYSEIISIVYTFFFLGLK